MSTLMVFAGAGLGAGVWLLVAQLLPPRVDPAVALGRFDAARAAAAVREAGGGYADSPMGRLAAWVAARGYEPKSVRADLALLGTDPAMWMAGRIAAGLAGLVAPVGFVLVMGAAGVWAPPALPAAAAAGCALGGFFAPVFNLRDRAHAARAELRHSLAALLDLLTMGLAGGRGLAEAVEFATSVGHGRDGGIGGGRGDAHGPWTFRLLAETAGGARIRGLTPWQALVDLGERIAMPELVDLGSTLELASSDGAKIRASLSARAWGIRARLLADETGKAANDNQSMHIAQTVLLFGFVLLIGFPAVWMAVTAH